MATALIEGLCAAHYERVGPLLEASLGRIPVASASFPNGFEKPAQWHVGLHDPPPAVATVRARTLSGMHTYLALHDRALAWAAHALGSVEFYSWAPQRHNFELPAFGRILLEPAGNTPPQTLCHAAHYVRRILGLYNFDAIVMLDGRGSIALWMPVADADYVGLSACLHQLAAAIVDHHPDLFVTQRHARGDGLVRIAVAKNAPGTFTALPYSARGRAHLPICLPVRWEKLHETEDGSVTVETLPAYLEKHGDVFALELARIGDQTMRNFLAITAPATHLEGRGHGHVLASALDILSDGKLRTAQQILDEAVARHLLPRDFSHKYLYTALTQYIERCRGAGRKPVIVQDEERNFRVNEPLDDWPPLPRHGDGDCHGEVSNHRERGEAESNGLIDRLHKTATGSDPAAFEIAVCDAFAHLGFATMHVGGDHAPDGYADAQLGALAYRAMLECKTAKSVVPDPDIFEAAKYRDAFGAQYCAIVGPAFTDELKLTSELHTHGVSAWTVADLQLALTINANANELRASFEPGYAADALADLLWERNHGRAKRVRVIADLIRSTGWHLQTIMAGEKVCHGGRAPLGATSTNGASKGDAALLTLDAAMVLVDEALAQVGSQRGCTREETQLAFEYLTNPIIGAAVWTDNSKTAIVIFAPCEATPMS